MTAFALLARLRAKGIVIRADGDRLRLRPRSLLTPTDLAAVTNAKQDILELLYAPRAYAFPWPDELPGFGAQRVGAYTSCADCAARPREVRIVTIQGREIPYAAPIGTWVHYGHTPLCLACALRRSL